jgi:hypothetical protein
MAETARGNPGDKRPDTPETGETRSIRIRKNSEMVVAIWIQRLKR